MRTQTAELKSRYTQELDAVLATVEPLPEAALRLRSPENQCSAGALAAHIAGVHANVANWVKLIVAGEPLPPLTMADIDRFNAEGAASNDGVSKAEVLTRLRAGGAAMTGVLDGLSDDDLTRSGAFKLAGGEITVQALVESAVIAHTQEHLASFRAAVADAAETSSR
jgi:hypothetical protein